MKWYHDYWRVHRPPGCGALGKVVKGCGCNLCVAQRQYNATRLRAHRRQEPTYVKRMNLKSYGLTYE